MSLVYTAFMACILYFSVRTNFLAFSHFTFENLFSREEHVNALHGTNEVSSDGVCRSIRNSGNDVTDDEYQSADDGHEDDACDRVHATTLVEPECSETSFSDEELSNTSSSETTEPDLSDIDDLSSPESDLSETQLCDITHEKTLVETDFLIESGTSTDLTEHNTYSVSSA